MNSAEQSRLDKFLKNAPPKYNLYFDGSELLKTPVGMKAKFDIFMRIMSDPVSRIASGEKEFELRKYVPLHTGLIFLFETDKRQAITGCIYFNNFTVLPVDELWECVGEKATGKERFYEYFKGKEFGVALQILDRQMFDNPITKKELFEEFPNLPAPPQPYVYLYSEITSRFSIFLRKQAKDIILRNGLG